MNKNITLIGSCLLVASTQVFADRPFMEDAPRPEPVPLEPTPVIEEEISSRPAAEPVTIDEPTTEELAAEPVTESRPVSAVEMDMQKETATTQQQTTGDVLELQPGETLGIRLVDFPRRGMEMDKVRNEMGDPSVMHDPVGDPPITRWIYSDRVVYFEHSKVLHVVAGQ